MLKFYTTPVFLMFFNFSCGEVSSEYNKDMNIINAKDLDAIEMDMSRDNADASVNIKDMSSKGLPCSKTSDCSRGFSCPPDEKICQDELYGCSDGELKSDEGCLYIDGGWKVSPKECDNSDDCKNSKNGEYCNKKVCVLYKLCVKNDDCPDNQMCEPYDKVCI